MQKYYEALSQKGRIARYENNKDVYVSSDMSYKQYKEKFIKKEIEINRVKGYNDIEKGRDYKPLTKKKIEKFRNQSNEVYKLFTKDEREVLSEYTQGGYFDINRDLAIDKKNSYEKILSNAIEKFNLSADIITYIGTCIKDYK